jgi:hypothetical protein
LILPSSTTIPLKGDFNQGLMGRQRDIDQALIGYIDRQTARKMNQPPQPPPRRNWISPKRFGKSGRYLPHRWVLSSDYTAGYGNDVAGKNPGDE